MGYAAFDLSKSSTGWGLWQPGWERPRYGSVQLGSSFTSRGQVFIKLHKVMSDLHTTLTPFEFLFMEAPINHMMVNKGGASKTTAENVRVALGLAAHCESFGHAVGSRRIIEYTPDSWRPDFIGRIESSAAKADARRDKLAGNSKASARDTLKTLTIARCRQLGFNPKNDDEADAIGILTYGILSSGEQPPWLNQEVLRTPVAVPA